MYFFLHLIILPFLSFFFYFFSSFLFILFCYFFYLLFLCTLSVCHCVVSSCSNKRYLKKKKKKSAVKYVLACISVGRVFISREGATFALQTAGDSRGSRDHVDMAVPSQQRS